MCRPATDKFNSMPPSATSGRRQRSVDTTRPCGHGAGDLMKRPPVPRGGGELPSGPLTRQTRFPSPPDGVLRAIVSGPARLGRGLRLAMLCQRITAAANTSRPGMYAIGRGPSIPATPAAHARRRDGLGSQPNRHARANCGPVSLTPKRAHTPRLSLKSFPRRNLALRSDPPLSPEVGPASGISGHPRSAPVRVSPDKPCRPAGSARTGIAG